MILHNLQQSSMNAAGVDITTCTYLQVVNSPPVVFNRFQVLFSVSWPLVNKLKYDLQCPTGFYNTCCTFWSVDKGHQRLLQLTRSTLTWPGNFIIPYRGKYNVSLDNLTREPLYEQHAPEPTKSCIMYPSYTKDTAC